MSWSASFGWSRNVHLVRWPAIDRGVVSFDAPVDPKMLAAVTALLRRWRELG